MNYTPFIISDHSGFPWISPMFFPMILPYFVEINGGFSRIPRCESPQPFVRLAVATTQLPKRTPRADLSSDSSGENGENDLVIEPFAIENDDLWWIYP